MAKKESNEKTARAYGSALPISTKQSIEICNFIRGKNLNKAIAHLKRVLEMKGAIPYKRFTDGVGHKPGIASGRYPQKASKHILELLESVKSNASVKNLDTDNLRITHLVANKASRPWRYGRQKRRKAKRTHVEIIVKEIITKRNKNNKSTTKKESNSENKKQKESETSKKEEVKHPTNEEIKSPKKEEIEISKTKKVEKEWLKGNSFHGTWKLI